MLRVAVDGAAAALGVSAGFRRASCWGVTVLMYHRVLPNDVAGEYPLQNLVVSEAAFREQMRWLASRCRVMTVREAIKRGRSRDGRPIVCVTFDDGYDDNYRIAAPLMEAEGIRGTFYVTTGFVEGRPLWFDVAAVVWRRLPRITLCAAMDRALPGARMSADQIDGLDEWLGFLKRRCGPAERAAILAELEREEGGRPLGPLFDAMTKEQVKTLHERGHEIGSHTVSHPFLPQLDDDALSGELRKSKRTLEEWIGAPVDGFCYPNGDSGDRVVRAVSEAGYRTACTTVRGRNGVGENPLMLKRRFITMSNSTVGGRHRAAVFSAEVLGVHQALAACAPAGLRRLARRGAGRRDNGEGTGGHGAELRAEPPDEATSRADGVPAVRKEHADRG